MADKTVTPRRGAGKSRRRLSPENAKYLPYPDFPLSPHVPTNRWYKTYGQRRVYYGSLSDPYGALALYERYREQDQRGRPRVDPRAVLTVRDLVNAYLTAQEKKVQVGELAQRTFDEYVRSCELIIKAFGRTTPVDSLVAADFASLRADLAQRTTATRLGIVIQQIRQVFKWGYDDGLLETPIRYGQSFSKPPARLLRAERHARGPKFFQAEEIRRLLEHATLPIRAAILLGINCAFGNTDVAELPLDALDLEAGKINFPRPKTGVQRRVTLWQETVDALNEVIAKRAEPKNEADVHRVFITKYGTAWVRYHKGKEQGKGTSVDNVTREFAKVRTAAGISTGRAFYALRHTFETIGGETGDQKAVDFIMGHAAHSNDMSAVYREWPGGDRETKRLRRITDHVHGWLFDS